MTIFRFSRRQTPPALDLGLYGLGLAVLVFVVLPGTVDGVIALKGAPPLRVTNNPLLFYGCLALLLSAAFTCSVRCAGAMSNLLDRRADKSSLKDRP